MQEVNFEVKQESLAIIQNTTIDANFDECKAALSQMMQPYQTLIVSEDGIADAKNDRARIRKVAGRIDDMRKAVKKAYNEPLSAFEGKCKELVSICDSGSANLDRQIKAFEERQKQEKLARLQQFYDGYNAPEEKQFCPWETVVNPKWGNKGFTEDDAKAEIVTALAKTREDIELIRRMDAQDVPYLLDYYKGNLDVREVMRKATEIKARREAEEQRKRNEAKREIPIEAPENEPNGYDMLKSAAKNAVQQAEPMQALDFRVWVTKTQMMALRKFLEDNKIRYGKVD